MLRGFILNPSLLFTVFRSLDPTGSESPLLIDKVETLVPPTALPLCLLHKPGPSPSFLLWGKKWKSLLTTWQFSFLRSYPVLSTNDKRYQTCPACGRHPSGIHLESRGTYGIADHFHMRMFPGTPGHCSDLWPILCLLFLYLPLMPCPTPELCLPRDGHGVSFSWHGQYLSMFDRFTSQGATRTSW